MKRWSMRHLLFLLSISLALLSGCRKEHAEGTANAAPPSNNRPADGVRHKLTSYAAHDAGVASGTVLRTKESIRAELERKVASVPHAGGPVKTTPRDLFADFTRPDADGLALLDKYRDGATFTGMLKTVGEDETGRPVLMMDVDGKNIISLDFIDPEQGKGHKQGSSLTVTCKIGGASGALMMLTDCVL
jgi:hypothetical protein